MTDPRVERTRAALAAAALALAGERDFAEVSVRDIVARAGVGYATFFRHFADKHELLLDVADQLSAALLPTILPALCNDDTYAASLSLCGHVDANRGTYRALLSSGAEPRVRQMLTERAVARGLSLGLPAPPGLPPVLAVTHSVHALLGLLAWWLDEGAELAVPEMAKIVDRLVLTPVRLGEAA